jgi:hypothetical protein
LRLIVCQNWTLIVPSLVVFLLGLAAPASLSQQPAKRARDFNEALGPLFCAQPQAPAPLQLSRHRGDSPSDWVLRWNQIAMQANALDHTPVAEGESRTFGEQLGPGRTSRAFAIVHIAIFDAVNAIECGYRSYTGLPRVRERTSMKAAIAQAAHDTLVALYPSQASTFDNLLAEDLSRIEDGREKTNGIALGQQAAAAILALRTDDGSPRAEISYEEYGAGDGPGIWRQDPVSRIPIALGAKWGEVRPFVMRSANQFRVPPPPALTSRRYTNAFNEVKRLGGAGSTPTERTEEQTVIGIYWGYDGTPGLGTPPRLYNQIAVHIADQMRTEDVVELARLLALIHTAMADAGIACWESKYVYKFWRPVGGIREASPDTSPTGIGDGNPATIGDPNFLPLGAPASNLTGPDFTPPFPAYPSGHATFGAALFQTLRNFYRTDRIRFTFVSDEFNGVTRDNDGTIRPRIPRRFRSLSEAEEENGQSRIYLGIHWEFDKTEGITQGRRVANYVFDHAFEPDRR